MEMLSLVHVVLYKHPISNVVTTKSEIKGDWRASKCAHLLNWIDAIALDILILQS